MLLSHYVRAIIIHTVSGFISPLDQVRHRFPISKTFMCIVQSFKNRFAHSTIKFLFIDLNLYMRSFGGFIVCLKLKTQVSEGGKVWTFKRQKILVFQSKNRKVNIQKLVGCCRAIAHSVDLQGGIIQLLLCVLFQVSDVEKIVGIVYTENIQVSAEAYDIALDISPGTKH